MDTRIIVAAGGSGGAAKAEGAPGRDENGRYPTCSNYKEEVFRLTILNSGNAKICNIKMENPPEMFLQVVVVEDIKVAFQPIKPVAFMIRMTSPLLTAALHACLSTDPV